MEPESIFRFVAVRPPTIKLPDLDPPSHSDPHADAIVEQRIADARAFAADETEARREAARILRDEDSLVASANGRALLKLTAEAERIYLKLPRRGWFAPFRTRLRKLLAGLTTKHEACDGDRGEPFEELRRRAWLTYYSGLLDPDREPWFEAARFWLRSLYVLEHTGDLPDSAPPPTLANIGLPAPVALWRIPPAPAAAAPPAIVAGGEVAREAALARGHELEALVTRLRQLTLRRRADLAAWSPPPAEVTEESTERTVRTPVPSVPLPADPPGDVLNATDRALLSAIGISPDVTPLPRCIDGTIEYIAHLAADLARVDSRVERQGRIYVRVDSSITEEPR